MSTETDDRITMAHMKILNTKNKFLNSESFKNMIIVFGMAISLFTITSFDTISQADASAKNIENQEFHENATVSQADSNYQSNATKDDQKLKTHHNFIASYLLQESSVKRNAKKADTEGNFVGGILRLHKIIITKTLGSF